MDKAWVLRELVGAATELAGGVKTAAPKKWDNKFHSPRDAKTFGDRRVSAYAPFHELTPSDQRTARRAYPHKSVGAKYDFIDEHYYYPVNKQGALINGRRVLAIPYKQIQDETYMESLGFKVSPKWKGGSVRVEKASE